MQERPFQKISVGDICERCGMNRKSFYYHFKDKYDLVNWIFDTEFLEFFSGEEHPDFIEAMEVLCRYLYENRAFYRKALAITGQNSFSDHFRELCAPAIETRLRDIMPRGEVHSFQVEFMTEGIVGALQRWLRHRDCMTPEEFMEMLRSCVFGIAIEVARRYGSEGAEIVGMGF
ncbi:MAG: TetR/AcrR family transcriptional regulator C-terminal domain-containing protein [Clostridia bacterium]|nr:TetR/AcrR family transcriptional regulator C-terminal domain-containing protein [Clostridia bacterium]